MTVESSIKIRSLNHHLYRTEDMEATRVFYEDLLELPLVGIYIEDFDVETKKPSDYIHAMFRMADGGCLAFFQFRKGMKEPSRCAGKRSPFEHHISLNVDNDDVINMFEERLKRAGTETFRVDHGYLHSLYSWDPNGMIVELSASTPVTVSVEAERRVSAHDDLRRWLAGASDTNNPHRARV